MRIRRGSQPTCTMSRLSRGLSWQPTICSGLSAVFTIRARKEATMSQQLEPPVPPDAGKKEGGVPEGLWLRCPECGDMLFRKVVEENLDVCPACQYHFRIS